MALINCPECKKEVSTLAETCPHCGCPLQNFAEREENFTSIPENSLTLRSTRKRKLIARISSFAIMLLLLIACKGFDLGQIWQLAIPFSGLISLIVAKMCEDGFLNFFVLTFKFVLKLIGMIISGITTSVIGSIIVLFAALIVITLFAEGLLWVIDLGVFGEIFILFVFYIPFIINVVCNILDIRFLAKTRSTDAAC